MQAMKQEALIHLTRRKAGRNDETKGAPQPRTGSEGEEERDERENSDKTNNKLIPPLTSTHTRDDRDTQEKPWGWVKRKQFLVPVTGQVLAMGAVAARHNDRMSVAGTAGMVSLV